MALYKSQHYIHQRLKTILFERGPLQSGRKYLW